MLILINGAIASGKTTVGRTLAVTLTMRGSSTHFVDLDDEVRKLNATMTWTDSKKRTEDWLTARRSVAEEANSADESHTIVVSGPLFTKEEINGITRHLTGKRPVYLYNLHAPLDTRIKREFNRESGNTVTDLIHQDKMLKEMENLFGHDIMNTDDVEVAVKSIFSNLANGIGLLKLNERNEL